MEHVQPYDQLIAKRMFREGFSVSDVITYLRGKYGYVNRRFVERLRLQVKQGDGRAY